MKIPARQRRKILTALHKELEGRSRCLTFKQMADFVNEHVPGWNAVVSGSYYRPERKLFARISWFGKERKGNKLAIVDGRGNVILEQDTTSPYHRNSYTLQEILSHMGCGSGTTKVASEELDRYEWFNPYGLPKTYRRRRR